MNSLDSILRQLKRFAARARAARYGLHALAGAVIWLTAVLLAARLIPIERRGELAAAGIALAIALAAIAWLLRRPSADSLMALADLRLGLKERLSTAWERR